MGTVAVSVVSKSVQGNKRAVEANVTYSNSYSTGGETLHVSDLGLQQVEEAYVHAGTLDATSQNTGYTPAAHGTHVILAGTPAAPKLKVYEGTTSEVANATNLSALTARIVFKGH